MFKIDTRDLERLQAAIAADIDDLQRQEAFRRAFKTHVTLLTPMLRQLCPKETGHLASTIRCTFVDGVAFIYIEADYAEHVVNGTSKQRPNDFIATARNATNADLEKRLATESFKNLRNL